MHYNTHAAPNVVAALNFRVPTIGLLLCYSRIHCRDSHGLAFFQRRIGRCNADALVKCESHKLV